MSGSKGNQTMKLGQLIEYNKRNTFHLYSCKKLGREASSRPPCFLKKPYYQVKASGLQLRLNIF